MGDDDVNRAGGNAGVPGAGAEAGPQQIVVWPTPTAEENRLRAAEAAHERAWDKIAALAATRACLGLVRRVDGR